MTHFLTWGTCAALIALGAALITWATHTTRQTRKETK